MAFGEEALGAAGAGIAGSARGAEAAAGAELRNAEAPARTPTRSAPAATRIAAKAAPRATRLFPVDFDVMSMPVPSLDATHVTMSQNHRATTCN
jgi:hypothetical protein